MSFEICISKTLLHSHVVKILLESLIDERYLTLFQRCCYKSLEMVKLIYSYRPIINQDIGDIFGHPFIESNLKYEELEEIINFLIDIGLNVQTSIYKICRYDNAFLKKYRIKIIKFLINRGANVNYSENGVTPLMLVASKNIHLMKILIENGADVNAIDNYGASVMIYILYSRDYIDKFKLLLKYGIDLNMSPSGYSVLGELISIPQDDFIEKDIELARFLLFRGAIVITPHITQTIRKEFADLLNNYYFEDQTNTWHSNVANGRLDDVKLMLKKMRYKSRQLN